MYYGEKATLEEIVQITLEQHELEQIEADVRGAIIVAITRTINAFLAPSPDRAKTTGLQPDNACILTDCGRPVLCKHLCSKHYGKKSRLHIKGPPYSGQDLILIGQDGRSLPSKVTLPKTKKTEAKKPMQLDPAEVQLCCAVPGCSTKAKFKGLCVPHYRKSARLGIKGRNGIFGARDLVKMRLRSELKATKKAGRVSKAA